MRSSSPSLYLACILACALTPTGCTKKSATTAATENPVQAGWEHYRLGEFDSAAREFSSAVANLPVDDSRRDLALYGQASTWNLRTPMGDQNKPLARQVYQQILDHAPASDLAAWSLLALARMQHLVPVGEEPDYEAVRGAYQNVVTRFPEHLAGHEAFMYLQASHIQTLQAKSTKPAVAALEDFITRHPDSGYRSGAYRLIAAGYETLHEPELQLAAELKSLESMEIDPSNPKFENSINYWRIATIAEFEVGDFEIARRFYRRLMLEYPQDNRIYACEEALQRMDQLEARLRREHGHAGDAQAGGGA